MKKSSLLFTAIFLLILGLQVSAGDRETYPLDERPVVIKKPAEISIETTQKYLETQKKERAKIWVFFTDKGVFDDKDFRGMAEKVTLNEHALKRRAKVDKARPVFADLPVKREYVDRITRRGAQLRRLSRWLNAASFEMDSRLMAEIARLPFVLKIQPVADFKSRIEVESPPRMQPPKFSPTEADALDYGSSWTQVSMINAPALHSRGHTGEGVIVAMLDTGYRKSHDAFEQAFDDGRVLGEYDFIFDDGETQNEIDDDPAQHNHGTHCWSTLGGYAPGNVIGPAYGASFLLAKTEDVRSETQIEEDNWVAAMEWADSLGADVISTSLSYSDWYTYEDFDGSTAVTTLAANTAAGLGIVVCNSIGNSGPSAGTLGAPSDAFNILACGAVDRYEAIAYFSSQGPTYDGRTKPEVCAMGVSTACADPGGDINYTYKNGTSLSTPLVGGAAALLLSANPTLNPFQVRKALMETADRASAPGNTYGWGIIDVLQAYNWGANFTADTTLGIESLTVNFSDSSTPPADSWIWSFGDGDSSFIQNPTHLYSSPGSYDVTLVIESSEGTLTRLKEGYISVIADTLSFEAITGFVGDTLEMSINLSNSQSLNNFTIPISYANGMDMILDRVTLGSRSKNFEVISEIYRNDTEYEFVFEMTADAGSGSPLLAPGSGEIARLFFVIDSSAGLGETATVDAPEVSGYDLDLANAWVSYAPVMVPGSITVQSGVRGDADNSGEINIVDVSYIINYLYKDGPAPITLRAGDADSNEAVNLLDATFLIDYLYKDGPPPEE